MKLLLTLLILIAGFCNPADACSRCGRAVCAYRQPLQTAVQQPYVEPYVEPVQQPDNVQNFIFNNAAPPTQTLYGNQQAVSYNPAVQAYTASAAELLQVTSDANQTLQGIAQLAAAQLGSETEINRLNVASLALQNVINAARESTAQATTSQAWILQMRNGEIQRFEQLQAGATQQYQGQQNQSQQAPQQQTGPRTPPDPTQNVSGGILTQKCAQCHGADKAAPAGSLFIHDGAKLSAANITDSLRWAVNPNDPTIPEEMKDVMGGLTDAEKSQLMQALLGSEG